MQISVAMNHLNQTPVNFTRASGSKDVTASVRNPSQPQNHSHVLPRPFPPGKRNLIALEITIRLTDGRFFPGQRRIK